MENINIFQTITSEIDAVVKKNPYLNGNTDSRELGLVVNSALYDPLGNFKTGLEIDKNQIDALKQIAEQSIILHNNFSNYKNSRGKPDRISLIKAAKNQKEIKEKTYLKYFKGVK